MAVSLLVCARRKTVSALICVGRLCQHGTVEAQPPLHPNKPSGLGVQMRHALLLIFLGASQADAQFPSIIPGARVRVEGLNHRKLEGTLMSQTADSITIAAVGAILTTVASGSLTRVRVSQGKSHGAGAIKGMKIGGGIGLGVGLLAGLVSPPGERAAIGMSVAGGALGGVIWGAAIGSIVGAAKWTTVYTAPLRIAIGRAENGAMTLGLAMRF